MARVYIGGDPFFCDALARRLRPLEGEGRVELLGDPVIADEKIESIRRTGGGLFTPKYPENIDRADVIVLLLTQSDMDPRTGSGRDFERALQRHRERRAILIVVPNHSLTQTDSRLQGVRVVPTADQVWSETGDPNAFLAQVVEAVQTAVSGPPPARLLSLKVSNITAFASAELAFSPGINVLIGPNGTGKTHILKLIYSALFVSEQFRREEHLPDPAKRLSDLLALKLLDVFKPAEDDLRRIMRRGLEAEGASILVEATDATLDANIAETGWITVTSVDTPNAISPVFIPSREGLTLFEGFLALYNQRRLAIDGTFNDLCFALNSPPLKASASEDAQNLSRSLQERLGGQVKLAGGRFLVATEDGEIEAHLMAEGLRKVATIARLIENGSLRRECVLFWDEPEANLNPKLIKPMVEVLQTLASMGVQVFLATHDYLFANRLSLAAQYSTPNGVSYRFFSFFRSNPKDAISVESGNTIADLDHSPIMDEFIAFYDERAHAFEKALQSDLGHNDA